MRTPPEQGREHHESDHGGQGSPRHVGAEDRLPRSRGQETGDQHPVPPHPRRRVRDTGLVEDRAEGGRKHGLSLESGGARRTGPGPGGAEDVAEEDHLDQIRETASLLGEVSVDDITGEMRATLLSAFRDFHR
jgi:hypothetical protein